MGYSSERQGQRVVRQGQVCAHSRQITRSGIQYWLGNSPIYAWWHWQHDDDDTVCDAPDGPDAG